MNDVFRSSTADPASTAVTATSPDGTSKNDIYIYIITFNPLYIQYIFIQTFIKKSQLYETNTYIYIYYKQNRYIDNTCRTCIYSEYICIYIYVYIYIEENNAYIYICVGSLNIYKYKKNH